ncbi:MAG: hypothetical protein R3F17_06135 [Planctomycetota bacterium]
MSNKHEGQSPEGFEEYQPSGKKKSGMSMKERLLAERRAAAEREAAGGQAAAPKAAAPKPAPKAPEKPAVQPAAARRSAPAAAAKAESSAEAAPAARPARASAAGGGARRSSARSGGSSRRKGEEEAEGGDEARGGRRGRGAAKKEKNMVVPAVAVLALAGLGGVAWWQFGGSKKSNAAESTGPAPATADSNTAGAPAEGNTPEEKPAETSDNTAKAETPAPKADKPAKADAVAPTNDGPAEVQFKSDGRYKLATGDNAPDDSLYDPNHEKEVRLSDLEPFGKPEGCSDEQWAEINEKVATMLDPDSGAGGKRAALSLQSDYGKNAFPAIVNGMLKVDYTTQEGHEAGDFAQRTLMELSNGRNASWNYEFDSRPNTATIANRRTVEILYNVWARVLTEPEYWDRYSGTEAARRNAGGGSGDDAPKPEKKDSGSSLDDLGLDE